MQSNDEYWKNADKWEGFDWETAYSNARQAITIKELAEAGNIFLRYIQDSKFGMELCQGDDITPHVDNKGIKLIRTALANEKASLDMLMLFYEFGPVLVINNPAFIEAGKANKIDFKRWKEINAYGLKLYRDYEAEL